MHIFFSGIGGVAIGPLARIARDAGYKVCGSDAVESRYTKAVQDDGIPVTIGQTERNINQIHRQQPIDWLVYTSSLAKDHPELRFAREHGIRTSKRHEFINYLLKDKGLRMLAVAGTHGKTNTTGMLIWAFQQLGIPASYSIGTNIPFGPNGRYQKDSQYFIYEADEFDRNFLHFEPYASIITSYDYDHPDTYPTPDDYKMAFQEFIANSRQTITWRSIAKAIDPPRHSDITAIPDDALRPIDLPGKHSRQNANLVLALLETVTDSNEKTRFDILNRYPGTERRMEKLAENLFTDYAHHPVEIRATLQAARELNKNVVTVYQPHQNLRQKQIMDSYKDCLGNAKKVYWLPTYQSREPEGVPVVTPEELVAKLHSTPNVQIAEMNEELWQKIQEHRQAGDMVLLMNAGNLDEWARQRVSEQG